MSGIEPPETPPGIPEEYAEIYREAYLRALAESDAAEPAPVAPPAPQLSRLERARAERAARQEQARQAKARAAEARAARAQQEQEQAEQARVAKARADAERAEAGRVRQAEAEKVRGEEQRVAQAEAERLRAEQAEVDRAKAEEDRARAEEDRARAEEDRAKQAEIDKARAEEARAAKVEAERLRAEKVRAEHEAAQQARAAKARAAAEKAEQKAQRARARHETDVEDRQELEPAVSAEEARASRMWLIIAIIALILIVAAYIAGDLLSDEAPAPDETGSAPAPSATVTGAASGGPSASSTAGPVWEGGTTQVAVTSASATCTAAPGVDSANRPVSYDIANALDPDDTTAWRCDGRARGETITLELPAGTEVGEVGLIPGYAKTDDTDGTDRYAENNRITRVRWTLADGVVVDQHLDPDPLNRMVQSLRVPRTATNEVTLEIRRVAGGVRNTTAISTVLIAAAT